jgi:PhnB protein
VSLLINCTSEEEINRLYAKLSEGGKIMDELKVQFWGDLFGVFQDRFGTNWMVVYSKNENQ